MEYINYISDDKMTYSYKAIRECVDAIKKFSWTAPKRKAEFWAIAMELKKLYEFLYEKTNCCLLAPDDWNDAYKTFFRSAYDYKNWTVKELRDMLKRNELYVKQEISSIYNMMERNEVNTVI